MEMTLGDTINYAMIFSYGMLCGWAILKGLGE
jgi:hypothetical protein